MRLQGKIAVITGGTSGIGKATALRFAKEGADVIVWARNPQKGEAFVEEAKQMGYTLTFMPVDVSKFSDVESAADRVKELKGGVDILINDAGITNDSTLKKMTSEQWQSVIDINLTGTFNCIKCFSPMMLEKGWGRIVNVSSVVGLYGNFGQVNYVATKSGIIGMTKTLGRELGRKGVTVNAVAPGFIATDMVAKMPKEVLDSMIAKVPVGRLGTPEDIAAMFVFLASDESSYINGATFSVDGGMTV
ncbi:MAG: 3-oxoacyl-[acyl-carrier-protein] reductase [Bacteroidales bacterium]